VHVSHAIEHRSARLCVLAQTFFFFFSSDTGGMGSVFLSCSQKLNPKREKT